MKKTLLIVLILTTLPVSAGQQSSAREYAEVVNNYVNKLIKSNHPTNPQLGNPQQYIKQGEMWYQTGVRLRAIDNSDKKVSQDFKKKSTLTQVNDACQDSSIDNTAMLGSIVATKAIIKACIKTVMDGYEAGE
ncbi:hypothetical protein [Atlantibacter hermannii]|uniref:hypothetical protein n=1 Tax=Atlantibacter hermannii TaxID=565 RepID=UPI00289CE0FD|nr:hypothetical protein [Atlantibacter hermannii]